jgi:uncharacterized protein YegJ (DUF2314 family)
MNDPLLITDGNDLELQQASRSARESFRYFWRELSWERRRIIPGLEMAMIKLPFTDGPRTDGNPDYEFMWVDEVTFDGDTLGGTLLNTPCWVESVSEGNLVSAPFSQLSDWILVADARAYGAFTVNLLRSRMKPSERKEHDDNWGLDFGDPADIRLEINHEPKPGRLGNLFGARNRPVMTSGTFHDHPMCLNMVPKIEEQLRNEPDLATSADDDGWTFLHHDALAGNLAMVRLMLAYGADSTARTSKGYTAADLARKIGWPEVAAAIDGN